MQVTASIFVSALAAHMYAKHQAYESSRIQDSVRGSASLSLPPPAQGDGNGNGNVSSAVDGDMVGDGVAQLVQTSPLFGTLGYACTRALVGGYLQQAELPRGAVIVRERDAVDDVVYLVKGSVGVTQGRVPVSVCVCMYCDAVA